MSAAPWDQARFLQDVREAEISGRASNFPHYWIGGDGNDADRKHVFQSTHLDALHLGTGASLVSQKILPAIEEAEHEIILVTCFWARSKTLDALRDALTRLARRREELIRQKQQQDLPALRVRICFSSRSLWHLLSHSRSLDGKIYPPSSWATTLGLPSPEVLSAGNIDLQVKSLFFLPFSVMHPKFVVVDRKKAFLPSCNVSWEAWFEGALEFSRTDELEGLDAIDGLLEFYRRTWEPLLPEQNWVADVSPLSGQEERRSPSSSVITSTADARLTLNTLLPIVWLPSQHNRNPCFRPFPWQSAPAPPPTPLNLALQQLFENATRNMYLQTPDVTCPLVLAAIMAALGRGVNVKIVTSRNMKIHEQLLTAGTTTDWCIQKLVRQYRALIISTASHSRASTGETTPFAEDLEAQRRQTVGSLQIFYFRPRSGSSISGGMEQPVHTHFKLSIFDGNCAVLGSGNMDRASWYTSQELGMLICNADFATSARSLVEDTLTGRLDTVYDSGT